MRRTSCEYTLAAGRAARGKHLRAPPGIQVKPEDHPDQLPLRQILQRMLEVLAGQQLDPGRCPSGSARLPRGLYFRSEGAAYKADCVQRQTRCCAKAIGAKGFLSDPGLTRSASALPHVTGARTPSRCVS